MTRLQLPLTMAFILASVFVGIFLGQGACVRHNAIGQRLSSEATATIHSCRRDPLTLWTTWTCDADIRVDKRHLEVGRHQQPRTVVAAGPLAGSVPVEGWREKDTETFLPAGRKHSNVPYRMVYGFGAMTVGILLPVLAAAYARRRAPKRR